MNISTKYDKGDTVFYLDNNRIMIGKIAEVFAISTSKFEISYRMEYKGSSTVMAQPTYSEDKLFATKEQLLKSL